MILALTVLLWMVVAILGASTLALLIVIIANILDDLR